MEASRSSSSAISAFVGADDIVRALGCSRTTAYEHLHRAGAKRGREERGNVRVTAKAWEAYAAAHFMVPEVEREPKARPRYELQSRRAPRAEPLEALIPITRSMAQVREERRLGREAKGARVARETQRIPL